MKISSEGNRRPRGHCALVYLGVWWRTTNQEDLCAQKESSPCLETVVCRLGMWMIYQTTTLTCHAQIQRRVRGSSQEASPSRRRYSKLYGPASCMDQSHKSGADIVLQKQTHKNPCNVSDVIHATYEASLFPGRMKTRVGAHIISHSLFEFPLWYDFVMMEEKLCTAQMLTFSVERNP